MTLPPPHVCERARATKDARFDGLFFTAVTSTRIYCRPVCPAPTPKPQNVRYFPSAAAAEQAGFRPCLRCRPERAPGAAPADRVVQRATALIAEGWLEDGSVAGLAEHLGCSGSHLRRLFGSHLGTTPLGLHQSRRLLLAKQLLAESRLSVTDVAFAAGFGSVNRLHEEFKRQYGLTPGRARAQRVKGEQAELALHLAYRPPLDWRETLANLARHAVPGVERVEGDRWERNVSEGSRTAWLRVSRAGARPELRLEAEGLDPRRIARVVRAVRRVFDLDADLASAHEVLRRDARLRASIAARPGLRIAGTWDWFEAAVALLLADRRRTPAANAETLRFLVVRLGAHDPGLPAGLDRRFPAASALLAADLESQLDIDRAAADRVRRLSRFAVAQAGGPGALDRLLAANPAELAAETGLSVRQARDLVVRARGDPDVWPERDDAAADALRPWRSYAALHLGGAAVHETPQAQTARAA